MDLHIVNARVVQWAVDQQEVIERSRALERATREARAALASDAGQKLEDTLCLACESLLDTEHGVCERCGHLLQLETMQLFRKLGPLHALGNVGRIEETKQSLRVLYASTFLGTNADRIATFLSANRTASRTYAMRFRAAGIWRGPDVEGPWRSTEWLSPAFCRLMFMDALVGAGFAVRGKDRWEFLVEEAA